MKKYTSSALLLLVAVLWAALPVSAENFNSLPVTSLTYDGQTLWGLVGKTIYRVEPASGEIIAKLSLPQAGEQLAYDGRNLLLSQDSSKKIFAVDQQSGKLTMILDLNTLHAPAKMYIAPLTKGHVMSLYVCGGKLWIGCAAGYSSSIYEIDLANQAILSHRFSAGPSPAALYLRKNNLWVLDRDGAALRCLLYTREGGLVDKIAVPRGTCTMAVVGAQIILASHQGLSRNTIALKRLDQAVQASSRRQRRPVAKLRLTSNPRDSKYAIIISGDTADNGFDEFWTDCIYLAKTLDHKCGYSPENIYFLFYKGQPPTINLPSYYQDDAGYLKGACYKSDIESTFQFIADQNPTEVFVYTFDHGSSWHTLCIPGTDVEPSDFDGYVNMLPAGTKLYVYMQQCYSGCFVTTTITNRPNTSILTACNASQTAHRSSHTESLNNRVWHHGEFNWWFMGALAKKCIHGTNNGTATGNGVSTIVSLRTYVIDNAAGSEQELFHENGVSNNWPGN